MLKDKRIVLGVTGGIAAYKACDLVSRLKKRGAGVRVVLAGGLSVGNIGAAAATGCAVLDVNSSLEESPGVKSIALLEELFQCWQKIRGTYRE